LRQYKTLSHQLRNYLLFDELPEDVDIPQEILNRQKLIRNNLMTKVGYIVIDGKELVFKIIDNLNTQTLFVYDSAQEYYWADTDKKVPNGTEGENIFSYFKYESRDCVHCAEEFSKDDVLLKLTTCGHVFHAECAEEYMYYNNTCPLCKQKIYDRYC